MRLTAICTLLLLLLLPTVLPVEQASALSCVEPLTDEKAYEHYDGIIVGHVEKSVTADQWTNQVTVTVLRSFKSITERTLVLNEDSSWGAINGPSEVGEDYLFFLRQTDSGWENPLCSPSKEADNAAGKLAFLADKELELPTGAAPGVPSSGPSSAAPSTPAAPSSAQSTSSPAVTAAPDASAEPARMMAADPGSGSNSGNLQIAAGLASIAVLAALLLFLWLRRRRK
ncbi:hypothetical protein [Paenibacillus tepidiphilus]|uniref:hypothetical protein n=1 Tax=Paenibacillus tepidiphilus TaxID=2608683 RepID=UPI001238B42E|nr:hypothetical protein [Paenibacillus tepidiphilus]